MELLIDHVSKRFKDKKAVNDISLELTPGVWGLLGANGAGKTTLMRMIAGIMQPTSGRVVYDGVPIQELGEQYRSIFGFLPQDFGFHPEFTVKDYLAYVAALKGLPERQSWRRIRELLERVSLMDVYNKKISKLSGGMRRRVGIAQALIHEPKLVLFDEPTAGLDPEERMHFKKVISQLGKKETVLISTHIVEDIEASCDRVIVMNHGEICCVLSCKELVGIAEGKVYACKKGDEQQIPGKYFIEKQYEEDGEIYYRILTNEACEVLTPVSPVLEDGYMCVIKEI